MMTSLKSIILEVQNASKMTTSDVAIECYGRVIHILAGANENFEKELTEEKLHAYSIGYQAGYEAAIKDIQNPRFNA